MFLLLYPLEKLGHIFSSEGEKIVGFFVNMYVLWDIDVAEISWNIPFAKVEH